MQFLNVTRQTAFKTCKANTWRILTTLHIFGDVLSIPFCYIHKIVAHGRPLPIGGDVTVTLLKLYMCILADNKRDERSIKSSLRSLFCDFCELTKRCF